MRKVMNIQAEGMVQKERPRKMWSEMLRNDLRMKHLVDQTLQIIHDRGMPSACIKRPECAGVVS